MSLIYKLLKPFWLWLFFVLFFSCQKGKDALSPSELELWTYFNTTNGLPSNKINCLAEDGYNNIWIGTDKGLIKFDGNNFTKYSTKSGLPSDTILALYWQKNTGLLLVGTQNGFGKINFIGKYINIIIQQNLACVKFSQDNQKDRIYCATAVGLLSYYYNIPDIVTSISDTISDVIVDGKNNTWFSSPHGVYNINWSENSLKKIVNNYYKLIFMDSDKNVWLLPYEKSIITIFRDTTIVYNAIFTGKNNYKAIIQDQYKNYWISSSNKGVINFGGGMSKVYNITNSKILSNDINTLLYDSKHNLWLGSIDKGLMYYQNIKPLQYEFGDGYISAPSVNSLY